MIVKSSLGDDGHSSVYNWKVEGAACPTPMSVQINVPISNRLLHKIHL